MIATPLELIDNLNLDGIFGAGVDAGGLEPGSESAVTHVALADDPTFRIELRDGVGAVPDAVLTTDAGFRGVKDDARDGILFVRVHGAAAEAIGREAVIASHREVVTLRVGPRAAFDLADPSPTKMCRVAVLLVARYLAGTATNALCHVEVETVLFAGKKLARRDKRSLDFCGSGQLRKHLEAFLGQAHNGIVCVSVCEFVKWERHGASPSLR
jgi:hypothetical protein